MTRRIIGDIVVEINNNLPDNSTNEISPADVRTALLDMVDSMTTAMCFVSGTNNPAMPLVLSTTPAPIPGTFFNNPAVSGVPAWMEARATPLGDIILRTEVGRLFVNFDVTFTAPNGVDVAFTLAQNGIPLFSSILVSGQGAINPTSASFTWLFTDFAVNDVFTICVSALTGTPTIDLIGAALKCQLLPQFIP